jgi:hypothetical protein
VVWVLDTEGFGSIEKDSSYDGKIFLLSLLLSNILLYNSFGAIDENSIAKLAFVCREAHAVDPKFGDVQLFWVLRDFSLEMVDRTGRNLTADEYLEECLKEGENCHNKSEKELLRRLFLERHCSPLIRPVINEQTLNNLQGIDKDQLRPEFKEDIEALSTSISQNLAPKTIRGMQLSEQNISLVV